MMGIIILWRDVESRDSGVLLFWFCVAIWLALDGVYQERFVLEGGVAPFEDLRYIRLT